MEDEAAIVAIVARTLARQGYTVLTAGTPAEAIRLASEHAGAIDLLMTDVIMPEMNGWDLAIRLRSLRPQLKCLFMSGYTAEVIASRGMLDEGMQFIQKPFALEGMAVKVRQVLDAVGQVAG